MLKSSDKRPHRKSCLDQCLGRRNTTPSTKLECWRRWLKRTAHGLASAASKPHGVSSKCSIASHTAVALQGRARRGLGPVACEPKSGRPTEQSIKSEGAPITRPQHRTGIVAGCIPGLSPCVIFIFIFIFICPCPHTRR